MSGVERPTRAALDRLAVDIRREIDAAEADFQSAVQHAVRAGELLIAAKHQVKHGEWLPWLEANFPGSVRSAQGYMRLAENAEDAQRVAHLGIKGALKQLAASKPADDGPYWHVWREECRQFEVAPPTPSEFRKWLAGGPISFDLLLIDREQLEAAHLDWLHREYAVPFLLKTGKYLPAPPSYEPLRAARDPDAARTRLQLWELDVARVAGKLLNDLAAMGLGSVLDPDRVNLEAAKEVLAREDGGWDAWRHEWGSRDVRAWAIGYAFSRLTVPKAAAS